MTISAIEGYGLWAEAWDETPSPIVALEERIIGPWIARLHPRRVVDVACGTGRWTARLGAIGVDASPAMLAIAARKPELRGRVAVADATAVPIADASADLVLCTLALGHIRDHAAAMGELQRVLAPGGTLILTDFHPDAAVQGWRRTFCRDGVTYELENHPYRLEELRCGGIQLAERVDAAIGEEERPIFDRAGRPDLFDAARHTPAVLATMWQRREDRRHIP